MTIAPALDDVNTPYWEGARNGVLRVQRCSSGHLRYPLAPVCPQCLSTDYTWQDVSGRGTVYTFGVFRHRYNEAWSERVPYAVAIVQLEEGPFVISDLVDVDVDDVRVGMDVQVRFDDGVPRFGPA